MTLGEQVAVEARSWVGTPFHWQASQKGVGADCKGVVAGVARELGLPEAQSLYAQMADYRRGHVDAQLLQVGLADVFDKLPAGTPPAPGDVLLLVMGGKPQHLAIAVGGGQVVVARAPSARVRLTDLAALLRILKLHSVWRWKERGVHNG